MKLRNVLLLLFTYLCISGYSQQRTKTRDIGIWTGIKVNYQFKDDYTVSFMQDLRLSESFTKINEANTDIGFSYTINKNFKLATNARYSENLKKEDYYSHDFRMNYDLQFKVKIIDNFKFRYRLRFQQVYENLFAAKRYKVGGKESNLRNRIQFDYTINAHKIYLSTELFRGIELRKSPSFNKIRLILGSEWENKLGDLNYAIAYERDLGVAHPLHYIFARVYYTFKFEKKNDK